MNGASLKEKLDKSTYDALTSAFRSALTPEQKDAYAKLKTDKERRDQLAAFVLDPAEFKAGGKNKATVSNERLDQEQGEWLMESQIG